MRLLSTLVLIVLAGCSSPDDTVLVCTAGGHETYRSEPDSRWHKQDGGAWLGFRYGQQYSPSAFESCRTERAHG